MQDPITHYWKKRLGEAAQALEAAGFAAHVAEDAAAAREIIFGDVVPGLAPKSVGFGGSVSLVKAGVYDMAKGLEGVEVLDTYDKTLPDEDKMELRRKSLLVDLFFTGTNAITEEGVLVNLDMIGNRVGALAFGPRNVVVLAGRNKLCADFEDAVARIKDYAAPVNTARLDKETPCAKTARCSDCASPDRICNTWVVNEKCFPKGRIIVVLVNEDLGF